MNSINLSIIVVSYNTKKITQDCLDSIYNSLTPTSSNLPNRPNPFFEIIIVDNASTDGSIEMLKFYQKPHPNITLIENKTNLGFAKANNIGIKKAKGDYILFLNSDIVVLNQAINKLLEVYKANENQYHFLGGKLLNADHSPQPSCGPFYSLNVVFQALFLKGDYWGLTRYSPKKRRRVDWISGACILTKKNYLEKLNGFDEKIFMYMDEIDLLYRAKKIGYRVFYTPEAEFIHLGSASSGGRTYPIIQVYSGFIYFYKKHHSKLELFILVIMLKLKAIASFSLGKLFRNKYLFKTYEKAYQIAKMD